MELVKSRVDRENIKIAKWERYKSTWERKLQKKYALLPTEMTNGQVIWLESYYKIREFDTFDDPIEIRRMSLSFFTSLDPNDFSYYYKFLSYTEVSK